MTSAQTTSHDAVVSRYERLTHKEFMSIEEAVLLSRELAKRVRVQGLAPDRLVGIANGALLMTRVMADELGIPFSMISLRRKGSRIKQVLGQWPIVGRIAGAVYRSPIVGNAFKKAMIPFNALEKGDLSVDRGVAKSDLVILVDDCIESGQTVRVARDRLVAAGAKRVVTCCLSWSTVDNSEAANGVAPDIFINRRIQHYPWSRNSPHWGDFESWLAAHGLSQSK